MKQIDWSGHAQKVREEIALQNEMESKGYVPNNPTRKAQLDKDLRHCEAMASRRPTKPLYRR
jgi:hypothetical protein